MTAESPVAPTGPSTGARSTALSASAVAALRERVGTEVIDDPDTVAELSDDSSVRTHKARANGWDRPLARLAVRPKSTEQVVAVVEWANEFDVPIVARGLGSGVVGSGLPIRGGVVVDMAAMCEVGEVDVVNRMVTVGPGVRLSDLEAVLKPHGLSVGHYPQSFSLASVAGSIAMRGSGTFSSLHGNVEDRLGDLEVVLPDGMVVSTASMPRAATLPDIKQLFVGAEGTLGIITRVTLRLVPLPEARRFASVRFPGFQGALDTVRTVLAKGVRPAVVRIYDPTEASAKHAQFADEGGWLLILVFDGDADLIEAQERITLGVAETNGGSSLGPEPAEHWEQRRFDWSWSTDNVGRTGGVAEAIEIAATWSELPGLYERLRTAVAPHMQGFMAHVSHVYDQGAALYVIVSGTYEDDRTAMAHYDRAFEAVMAETLSSGARISHHHGVGVDRARWVPDELGTGLDLLRAIKRAVDPKSIMNPGKAGL
ncbi:FAD-binding oxidoreductase [Streptomyces sp. SID3343]|uniref:FAD-binding oxidoreductase n=1 Tax=Streptomyces sp. SID3343 TaxID=2690260 RepID=UPI001367EC68|nr:FAD-binding oxidoreductase [Streptomyces sp. SID3343]MYW05260.1 FAD-binding protein [Streptomyces sp. SID3343]